jgi:hypothetical protein
MEIKSSSNHMLITGNIKSIQHYHMISQELEKLLQRASNIQIHIIDSISITSSIIGYFCKLVTEQEKTLSLFIQDDGLHELLDDLNLLELLNVQKI